VAGLWVLTVDRLAELIAAPALTGAGRRPATSPVVAAAWRRALAEGAGVFAPVAEHPATVQALAGAHRELREVADRRVTELLARKWYDTTDLRRAAAAVLHGEPRRGREIGEVVLFLPQELAPSATALLRELPANGLQVVAGRTGEEQADAGVVEAVRGLGAGDDREIWFRGSADWVDRAGSALVVVDYRRSRPETRPVPRSVRPAR
jgi:hypothetical protein